MVESSFNKYRELIENRLSEFLNSETERSRYSKCGAKYPYSLYDPLNYIMSGGGKRIRPILVLLSCEAFGGDVNNAINAAICPKIHKYHVPLQALQI